VTLDDAKKVVEIAALAVAGAWAIYGFIVLRHREKAAAELRKLELDSKKAELEARAVAVVRADITATCALRPDGPGYCILAEVTLTNEGMRDTRIRWEDEPPAFVVQRAEFGPDGTPQFGAPPVEVRVRQAREPNADAVSHVIRAGGTQRLAFAANVPTPGTYFVSFRGVLAPEERAVSVDAGADPSNPISWTATTYILVRDTVGSNTRAADG